MGKISLICKYALNLPLDTVSSKEKSISSKIVSGLAIGILSILSLGYYAVYTFRHFANRKVIHLQKELEKAIEVGDINKVSKLFKDYPALRVKGDLFSGIDSSSHISLMLPLAAEKGHLEMVKFLRENAASIGAFSRGNKTALERAIESDHEEIITYLLDQNAQVSDQALLNYMRKDNAKFKTLLSMINKFEKISSKGKVYSFLGEVGQKYDENPEKCKKILDLLILKGDRLTEKDKQLPIPQEAHQFIEQSILSAPL